MPAASAGFGKVSPTVTALQKKHQETLPKDGFGLICAIQEANPSFC